MSVGFAHAHNNHLVLDSNVINQIQKKFDKAFTEITNMLDGKQPLSFKQAVFLVENAYFNDSLNYELFNNQIEFYKKLTIAYSKANKLSNYHFKDSINETLNASLFKVFADTIRKENNIIISTPFQYNFNDALGSKEHANVFVYTLLFTKKGNCRSLPYLYKILTEELGTNSYLALAPMHMYIKQRNKNVNWYNVELTSKQYPNDAYLVSSGHITQKNIINGLYMDTLSLKESIALCLTDLAQAYRKRLGKQADAEFQLKCAVKALIVKQNLIDGLLIKQRIAKYLWQQYLSTNIELANDYKKQYEQTNATLLKLDYSDVPYETFIKWYNNYQNNKQQFQNSTINHNFKTNKK